MGKVAIRVIGSLFLLWGLRYIIDFLWTGHQPDTLIRYVIFGYNIAGLVFVIILLGTGFSLIKLENSGRILGLIILWIYFLLYCAFSIFCFIFATNPEMDFPIEPGWLIFKGRDMGINQNYNIQNPWAVFAFFVLTAIFTGVQIYILSSKKNRLYFTIENSTGS